MKKLIPILLIIVLLASCAKSPERPNVVFILADDMGYGDVSMNNPQSKIPTPNIDKLAEKGIRFTDAHSTSSVCTPSRYSLLTGQYSWRTRLQSGVLGGYAPHLIEDTVFTMAEMFQEAGYQTACVGKWHLGWDWATSNGDALSDGINEAGEHVDFSKSIKNGPVDAGFDYFYGISASLDIPPYVYVENSTATLIPVDTIGLQMGKSFWRKGIIAPDFNHQNTLSHLTEKACGFIQKQSTKQPFFLYFPLTAPHTPILPGKEFEGKSQAGVYGDFVYMVDWVVGEVVKQLKKQGFDKNTLIVFTSDNGASSMADFDELASLGHYPSYVFRGKKTDLFEGGHRLPFVMYLPGKGKKSKVFETAIGLNDIMATFADLLAFNLPKGAASDSRSFWPALTANKAEIDKALVQHSVQGKFAIRKGDWKLINDPGSGGSSFPSTSKAIAMDLPMQQLYNLKQDSAEAKNLLKMHTDKAKLLSKVLNEIVCNQSNAVQVEVDKAMLQKEIMDKQHSQITHMAVGAIINSNSTISAPALQGINALVDGKTGSLQFNDGYWTGVEGGNLDVLIDLGKEMSISKVKLGTLSNYGSWIFAPKAIEIEYLDSDKAVLSKKTKSYSVNSRKSERIALEITNPAKCRFLKINVINSGICPTGHPGAGQPCWMFIDEMVIN
jgi:arylsulfatase A-like enzyme